MTLKILESITKLCYWPLQNRTPVERRRQTTEQSDSCRPTIGITTATTQ